MLPIAILAGGLATRLRPITETISKSLVEVAGRPFITWQLDYLRGQGIRCVVLCIGHLGEQIEAVVGNGNAYGLEIVYSADGARLLGTGGALKKALPLLGSRFFVLYGDVYLPVSYAPIQRRFIECGKSALMAVFQNRDAWDKSNAALRDGLVEYDKKAPRSGMAYIDYGLGVLSATAFDRYSSTEAFDLADLYRALSSENQLAGYEVAERFYEIGSPQGLRDTIEYFALRAKNPANLPGR